MTDNTHPDGGRSAVPPADSGFPPPPAPPAAASGQHELPRYEAAPASPLAPPAPGYGQASGYAQAPYYSSTPGSTVAPGYAQPPYAAPRPTNGLAVTSMICGIAGLALSAMVLPILASIAAVILGHMALNQLKRSPAQAGRGMAIAGLILGYVGCAVMIVMIIGGIISAMFFGFAFLPFFF